ncbi:hypothetical protein [Salinigranum halophilum]|nr:hypothetical protein [Salinigranum halophilum]
MVDERVVAVKLEQIEQYHSELKQKQDTLSREEFLRVVVHDASSLWLL